MSAPQLVAGQIVAGKYAIQALLQHGGLVATYHAITAPHREVALKLYDPALKASSDLLALLRRNETATNSLPANWVVHILGTGEDPEAGLVFSVTDLSVNPSLAQLVELCPLAPPEAIAMLRNLATVIDLAHSMKLAHLGLKPSNLFVGPAPAYEVRVVDFGMNLLRTGRGISQAGAAWMGWIAPEQLTGPGGPAADVFSAALLAFFAMTGRSFWRAAQRGGLDLGAWDLEARGSRTPASARAAELGLSLPSGLDAPFARALSDAPADRFPSVGAFASALSTALEGRPMPQAAPPQKTPEPGRASIRFGTPGPKRPAAPQRGGLMSRTLIGIPGPNNPFAARPAEAQSAFDATVVAEGPPPVPPQSNHPPPVGGAGLRGAMPLQPSPGPSFGSPGPMPGGFPGPMAGSAIGGATGTGAVGPRPMGPGAVGPRPMGPGAMGPGAMGPGAMGPGAMGPGAMGPGAMGPMGPAGGPSGVLPPRPPLPSSPVGRGLASPVGASGAYSPGPPGLSGPAGADLRLPPKLDPSQTVALGSQTELLGDTGSSIAQRYALQSKPFAGTVVMSDMQVPPVGPQPPPMTSPLANLVAEAATAAKDIADTSGTAPLVDEPEHVSNQPKFAVKVRKRRPAWVIPAILLLLLGITAGVVAAVKIVGGSRPGAQASASVGPVPPVPQPSLEPAVPESAAPPTEPAPPEAPEPPPAPEPTESAAPPAAEAPTTAPPTAKPESTPPAQPGTKKPTPAKKPCGKFLKRCT